MSFHRILIAVDDSPIAERAAEVGLDLARALDAEAALLYAVDPAIGFGADGGITPGEIVSLSEREAKALLARVPGGRTLRVPIQQFVMVGKPAPEIVKAVGEWRADLVVVGSHGRGGIGRTVLGSVAEAVVRHAPCPVLVVRVGT